MTPTTKKIMIFGRPGGGKSTFANALSKALNIPVHHLDKHFFISGWAKRDHQEFLQIQQKLVSQKEWIIDGNSTKTLEMRWGEADLILYFDISRYRCLWRIFKRLFTGESPFDDRADGCKEQVTWKLVRYLWTFETRATPLIQNLQKKYPDKKLLILKTNQEIQKTLYTTTNGTWKK